MEKIKAVFSPGSSKDDEILYGNEDARRKESSLENPTEQQPAKLYPVEGAAGQKESGGILSQITNPDGAKYDERAFETSATTAPDPNKLHTDPETKNRTILNQITNPGGHKYDEQKFGETATTVGTEQERLYSERAEGHPGLGSAESAGTVSPNTKLETDADHKKDHSILRQILNPGGKNRDDVAYGTTAHASGDKVGAAHTDRSEPLGNTVAAAGVSATLPDRSTTTGQNQSSIAGPAYGESEPVIAGIGASTAPRYNEPQTDVLDRSHPLRDGSGAAAGHLNPIGAPEASKTEPMSQSQNVSMSGVHSTSGGNTARSADSHINPIGAPSTTNSALLGTGAVAAGGLAASSRAHDDAGTNAYGSSGQSSNLAGTTYGDRSGALGGSGDTSRHHPDGRKLDCDGNPERGYVHHVSGPHSTDAANQLDPALSNTSTSATRDRGENRGPTGGGVVGGATIPATTTSNTTGVSSGSEYPGGSASASGPSVVGAAAVPATMSSNSNSGYSAGNTSTTGSSAHSQQYAGASQSLQDPIGDRTTGHAHTRDEAEHEKKQKPSLIQKILHPGGHKEEKNTTHDEHNDQRMTVDDHGRNVLHKKSAPLESQAGNQAAAGPDWDAVNKAN